jgi:hypothetical protein
VSRARDRITGAAGGSIAAIIIAGAEAYRVLAGVEDQAQLDGASCAHVLEYVAEQLNECRDERVGRRP